MPDLVMPKVDGLEKKKYPGLKVPSPAFNVLRMRDKKPTGILSRIERTARVGVDQVLLNELNKPEDKPHAFAIVKMGKGRQLAGIGAIPKDIVEGVDEFTLREFQKIRTFWYYPLELVRAFDPAIPMSRPAPGRRFASEVDIPSGDAAAAVKGDDPPNPFIDEDGRARAVTKFDRLEIPADRFVAITPGEGTPWRVSRIEARDEVAAVMEAGEMAADRGIPVVHFAQQVGIAKDRPVFEIEGVVAAIDDIAAARHAVELADPVRLKDSTAAELRLILDTLRRFHQLHFEGEDKTIVEDLSREDVLNAFVFTVQETRRRGIPVEPKREIDSEAMDLVPGLFKADHKCKYCSEPATKKIVWADGRGQILVCAAHVKRAEAAVAEQGDKISSIHDLDKVRGAGLGVDGERQQDGGGDVCVCPECGKRIEHERGSLCVEMKCPACGVMMQPEAEKKSEAEGGRDELQIEGRKYAPTYPSGEKSGRRIRLEEVLDRIKRFQFRKDAVVIVGGLANHGFTDNDIDVLIKGPLDEATLHVLKFRIGRMLGPELSRRVQFLEADEYGGPFTDHVVIGHLCVDTPSEFTVKEMRAESAKQDDPLLDPPTKKGKLPAVMQLHFRGRTAHLDFRMLVGDHLVGWSVTGDAPVPVRINGQFCLFAMREVYDLWDKEWEFLQRAKDGRFFWGKATGVACLEHSGELVKSVQKNGVIETTPSHSLIDENGNSFQPEERRWCAYCREIPPGKTEDGPIRMAPPDGYQLAIDDHAERKPRPRVGRGGDSRARKIRVRLRYETEEQVESLLTVIAWYLTEGCAHESVSGEKLVHIANSDRAVLDRVKLASKIVFPGASPSIIDPARQIDGCGAVKIGNIVAYDTMVAWCGKGHIGKRIPNFVWSLPTKWREFLLHELIAGDGSRDVTPNAKDPDYLAEYFSYSSQSPLLAAGVGWLAVSLGQDYAVRYQPAGMNKNRAPLYGIRYRHATRPGYGVKKLFVRDVSDEPTEVFDVVGTASGNWVAGVGGLVVHNTLPIQRAGTIKEPVTTLAEARRIARGYDVAEGNRFLKPMLAPSGTRAEPKARQPKIWLGVGDSVYEPGTVGATRNFPGVILEIDRPKVEFGRQGSRFHEYFVTDSKLWNGIWFARLLVGRGGEPEEEIEAGRATRAGETFWKFSISKQFLPSILKPRTARRGDMPPDGTSWIPTSLERDVPAPFQYWKKKGAEAKRTRDALVEEDLIDEKSVRIVNGEFRNVVSKRFVTNDDGSLAEVEKAMRQPWRQYGGADKYARWLADRLPDHKVYVEPFAGAAAVLFAKEPAEKNEVISDIDSEIVFAFRFIKNLSKESFAALKRLEWRSSRAAYDRARKTKTFANDAQRFWRHAFGRFCAWSGVPGFHGYRTAGEGDRYDLEALWKLKERLKNVTILCQDWRKTVAQFDGPDTLFFIDPPYVGEWDQSEKHLEISPDKVAAALRGIEGEFVIAYTDAPAVRREFAAIGHNRRLAMTEAHRSGSKAGSRLFSSSFRIAKSIDAMLVEKQPTRVRYTLARQSFRGPIQIRSGFSKVFWWLVLDRPGRADVRAWRLLIDPTSKESEIVAVKAQPGESQDKALLELTGHQEPGTRFNPTKDTPSDVAVLGRGRVEIIEDDADSLNLRFLSGPITGRRSLVAEESGSDLWEFTRGVGKAPTAKAVPMHDDVQVWNPDQKDPDADRSELRPLAIFAPMKPRKGWLDPGEFLEEWPTPKMVKSGIDVEPKYNGLRVEAQVDGRGRTLIYFEDSKDDRSEIMPGVAAELKAIARKIGPFILDAELIDHDADGKSLPRRTLSRFTGPVGPQDDTNVRLRTFRLLFGLGKNWATVPRFEARPALQEFFRRAGKPKHLALTPARRARSIEAFPELIRWASNVPGSEGAMFKLLESTYSLGGFSSSWAKLKIPRTIRAIVIEKIAKEPGPEQRSPARTFVYRAAVGPISEKSVDRWDEVSKIGSRSYTEIGRTFATNVQAKVGDVLEVKATELLVDQTREKHSVRWFTPVVVGKTDERPNTPDEIIALAFKHEIKRPVEKHLDREVPILKAADTNDEERIAYGIVLEPETCDSQKEIYSADEIRTAAHQYMEHFRHAGLMHQTRIDGRVRILESFIAPADFEIEGVRVKRGTWLMAMRVVDDKLWEAVKDKRLTGFSIGGSAVREPAAA